ncbi:unnamed protein product [Paramecium primaurelia]|uniref:Uncharacterized protein n=1 Tax=Paramecium primaurelia TaxID=5886 RepID=A0A8S1K315_PARPR|nr:unnamed protein product [Paramecium primaurelia]
MMISTYIIEFVLWRAVRQSDIRGEFELSQKILLNKIY